MKRVVITGIGLLSPIGNTKEAFWDSLKNGRHGMQHVKGMLIPNFDPDSSDISVVASVKNYKDEDYGIDKKEARRIDMYTRYALAAAHDCVKDSGSDFKDMDPYRVGVIIGTGIGGMYTWETHYKKWALTNSNKISPFCIPMMITNMASGRVAMEMGFKGVNFAPATACATSSHAIGEAYKNIKHGYLDACLTGGSEAAVTGFGITCFSSMRTLSKADNLDRASIPFDAERNGFVIGDGAGLVMLEELEHAKARGAHIYAEIAGYGATADAYHITSPDPSGEAACAAMKIAMEQAGITPEQVGYINAHGTSTELNDKYETIAIKKALGEKQAYKVPVSSTKSMTGHLLGGAGAVEAIAVSLALENGVLPPTAGYEKPDPDCDLDYVPNTARKTDAEYALSNSFGFGGQNATICFRKV